MMPLATPFGGEKTGDDPYWDKVVFLANMNGTNGSTTFIDSSPNFAAANGNAKVTNSVTLFGDTVGTFDGTDDYISLPYLSNYNIGSANFTIEFFFSPASVTGQHILFDWRSATNVTGINIFQSTANPTKLSAVVGDSNTAAYEVSITGTTTLVVGTMYHARLVKNGTNWQLYLQGASEGSATSSVVPYINAADIRFGASRDGSQGFSGEAADLMISDIARNTSGFTPPSARLTADANTLVLIPMNGANNSVLFENIAPITKLITPSGNAQISTANFKFGGASGLFDGAGDFVTAPVNPAHSIATGDVTLEAWVYIANSGAIHTIMSKRQDGTSNEYTFNVSATGSLGFVAWSSILVAVINISSTTTIATGVWTHCAVSRSGTTWRLFVKGKLEASGTQSGTVQGNTIGLKVAREVSTLTREWDGNIDDVRITRYCRYTADFTPPRRQLGKNSPW